MNREPRSSHAVAAFHSQPLPDVVFANTLDCSTANQRLNVVNIELKDLPHVLRNFSRRQIGSHLAELIDQANRNDRPVA